MDFIMNKVRLRCSFALVFFQFALFYSCLSVADECPAVNCDCESLAIPNWQKACTSYESILKEECVANDGNPTNYCAVHGASAFPVAVAFKPIPISAPIPSDETEFERRLDMVLWSLSTDMELANERLKSQSLAQVFEALKIIDDGLDTAFSLRQAEDNFLQLQGVKVSDRNKKWQIFAENIVEHQVALDDFSVRLQALYLNATEANSKRSFASLSVTAWRVLGKSKELLGVVYHEVGNEKLAAKSWDAAASASEKLIAVQESLDGKPEYLEYFRILAATELHRSSFHWLLEGNIKMAQASRQRASLFMKQTQGVESLLMANTEK